MAEVANSSDNLVGKAWQETILHSFAASPDGSAPDAPPVFDADGVLYGTTLRGGNKGCRVYAGDVGCGTVFAIDHPRGEVIASRR